MIQVNTVNLIGNLTRDPERRETRSETSVVTMRLAQNTRNKVNYIDVTVFGKLADLCLEYLAKGRSVGIEGRLDYQEWKTPQGIRRSKLEVIASEVDFLNAAPRAENEESQTEAPQADVASIDDTAPKSGRRKAKDEEPVAA